MSTVIGFGYSDKNLFYLDYQVNSDEYKIIREKVIDSLIAEVEINGFRKGKAPREKALALINPTVMGQQILESVLNAYSNTASDQINGELKKDDRTAIGMELEYKPEFTTETEDGGFKMRIIASLLPAIDIKGIENLTIEQPTQQDITDLPSFVDFKQQELGKLLTEQNQYTASPEKSSVTQGLMAVVDMHGSIDDVENDGLHSHGMQVVIGAGTFLPVFEKNLIGLKKGDKNEFDLPFPENYGNELAGKTAQVKVHVTDILVPKYLNIAELLEGTDTLKQYYTDQAALEKDIENVFKARTDQVLDNIRRKRVVEAVLKVVPNFEIDTALVESETERIYSTLVQEASVKKVSLGAVLSSAGLSTKPVKVLEKMDKDQVRNEVTEYVQNEVKLTNILSLIYQVKVSDKPTTEEFETTIKEAITDKKKYNIDESFDEPRVRNVINDRIIRQGAGNYLLEIAKKNQNK